MCPQPARLVREERPTDWQFQNFQIDSNEWQKIVSFEGKELASFRVKNTSTVTATLKVAFVKDEPHPAELTQDESLTWDTSVKEIWCQRGTTIATKGFLESWAFEPRKKGGEGREL